MEELNITKNNDLELLKYIAENGIIDLTYVQEQLEMEKRAEILKSHRYSIWYSEKEDAWYTHLPDDSKPNNRRKIKRKKKNDLERAVYDYYMSLHNDDIENAGIDLLSIEKLFYEFMQHKAKEVSSGTVKRMMIDWNRFYKPKKEFISIRVQNLTKINIDDFFNSVLGENSLKKKAFYNMCGILKQMLEYAADAEYIEKNPYRIRVNRKKFASSSKKPSDKEVYQSDEKNLLINEMERRLKNNPSNTAPLAVLLDFELGVRKGEILAISRSDIADGRIHIHRQVVEDYDTGSLDNIKRIGFRIADYTKSEDGDRWLPLTQKAMEIISRIEAANKEYGYGYKDFLFVKRGSCLSPDAVDAQIKSGCEHIGIPVKTMHKIRKTYASTLLHNGVNISIVKDMLGHADESTTLKHYIYNTEDSRETNDKVLSALGDKKDMVKGDQSDQNIISFPEKRKADNPLKSKVSAN